LISKGKAAASKLLHARILLKADAAEGGPGWTDERIVESLEASRSTVERLRERFVEEGLEAALERRKQERRKVRIIDGEAEAELIALSCGPPPEGRSRWTLKLLAGKMVELAHVEHVCAETVRKTLKKTVSNRG
jgi:transposase